MTYFNQNTVAERYAKGRPDSHSIAINRIRDYIKLEGKVKKALDIACGTGLSTKALLNIAENVYGTDISQEMLNLAPLKDRIHYSLASAEKQPFSDNEFDIITVCAGIHWFDIDIFLHEANRLLKNNSWLILYATYGITKIDGDTEFNEWLEDFHNNRFPYPSRNTNYKWTNDNLKPSGFLIQKEEKLETSIPLSKQQLSDLITSQSNITNAVENGATTYNEIDKLLSQELEPFYKNQNTREICFSNSIMFLRKE